MKIKDAIAMMNAMRNTTALGYKFRPKAAYAVALNSKRLEPELSAFEEARKALLKDFAALDDKGEMVLKKNLNGEEVYDIADQAGYQVKYDELIEQPCDAKMHMLSGPDELGAGEIDPMTMLALLPMITEQE